MAAIQKLFPDGKVKALTMSYDDGITQDKKLISIFDKYSIKGTFNINSGCFGQVDQLTVNGKLTNHSHIPASEIGEVYKNHEVALHTLTHPALTQLTKAQIAYEVIEDKKNIEEIIGYPVRGMAYPYGVYNYTVLELLSELEVEYSRGVVSTHNFELPKEFLAWQGTCHHNDPELFNLASKFLEEKPNDMRVFYLWGHSYEFDAYDNWDRIEEFCKLVGNKEDIWYASNIEIVDYINAQNSLKFSCTGSSVYNPSGIDVWISVYGKALKIKRGATVRL